jgi:hypothetical protein
MRIVRPTELNLLLDKILDFLEESTVEERRVERLIRLANVNPSEPLEIVKSLLTLINPLQMQLTFYENQSEFELCVKINKVIDLEIQEYSEYIKDFNCHTQEYEQLLYKVKSEQRIYWTMEKTIEENDRHTKAVNNKQIKPSEK